MIESLVKLPDGTVKQTNPFTGTEVWTVPGRANRPLTSTVRPHLRLNPDDAGRHCAFCPQRMLETPPEKARRVRDGDGWRTLRGVAAEELHATQAEFRLIPNLFEIVSLDYWRHNHGLQLSPAERQRRRDYLSTPQGRGHVLSLVGRHRPAELLTASDDALVEDSIFGGFHDVIVARRHHRDGATCDDELASSSTLTRDEHREFIRFTVEAILDQFAANPHARNVVAFQNWLGPAGASFDHLHKQLVAIDELGRWRQTEAERLIADPDLFTDGLDYLVGQGLTVAENEHAVLLAGVGHRYPSLEVWMRRPEADLSSPSDELDAFADLVHAGHAASGPLVPNNEEWHYRPPGLSLPIRMRVVLKWRISTPAGFEGGSRIYVNSIDPWTLAKRARANLATTPREDEPT